MEEHLGDSKHAVEGRNLGNSRNSTRSKTIITEIGPVEIEVPRDRDSSFDPQTVHKGQRRLDGVDSMVISLTAKGLTTGTRRRLGSAMVRPHPGRARATGWTRSRQDLTIHRDRGLRAIAFVSIRMVFGRANP
jgi:transposase-like protein